FPGQDIRLGCPKNFGKLGQHADRHVLNLVGFVPIVRRPILLQCLRDLISRQAPLFAQPLNPFADGLHVSSPPYSVHRTSHICNTNRESPSNYVARNAKTDLTLRISKCRMRVQGRMICDMGGQVSWLRSTSSGPRSSSAT